MKAWAARHAGRGRTLSKSTGTPQNLSTGVKLSALKPPSFSVQTFPPSSAPSPVASRPIARSAPESGPAIHIEQDTSLAIPARDALLPRSESSDDDWSGSTNSSDTTPPRSPRSGGAGEASDKKKSTKKSKGTPLKRRKSDSGMFKKKATKKPAQDERGATAGRTKSDGMKRSTNSLRSSGGSGGKRSLTGSRSGESLQWGDVDIKAGPGSSVVVMLTGRDGVVKEHVLSGDDSRKLKLMTPGARAVFLGRIANESVQSISLDNDGMKWAQKQKSLRGKGEIRHVGEKKTFSNASVSRLTHESQEVARKRSAKGIKMMRQMAHQQSEGSPTTGNEGRPRRRRSNRSVSDDQKLSPRRSSGNSLYWLGPAATRNVSPSLTLPNLGAAFQDNVDDERSPPAPDSPRSLRRCVTESSLSAKAVRLRRTGSVEDLTCLLSALNDTDTQATDTDADIEEDEDECFEFEHHICTNNGSDDVTFVCISDTHSHHSGVMAPPGDVLIHAGDFSYTGSMKEMKNFCDWLAQQPHRHKVIIAGNHDVTMQKEFYATQYARWHKTREDDEAIRALLREHCIYLEDSSVWIDGIHIYGSPWQPWFLNWAFNLARGAELRAKWDKIPEDVDVLLTHGPPHGYGDTIRNKKLGGRMEHVGDVDLMAAVARVRPAYHIFGHVHEGAGVARNADTVFANCSSCNENYKPWNKPFVFKMKKKHVKD